MKIYADWMKKINTRITNKDIKQYKNEKYQKETEKWIDSKMKGYSGCYSVDIFGRYSIGYIYGKSKLTIMKYNIILFIKFITKIIKK